MRRTATTVALAALLPALLGGCLDGWIPGEGESRGYKGATDDLLSTPAEDRAKSLGERFELIQAL